MRSAQFSVKPFDSATKTIFAAAADAARAQPFTDPLPPGSIAFEARERGSLYAKWRRVGADGKPLAPQYLGAAGSQQLEEAQARLADLVRIADYARNLRKLGYAAEDASSAVVLAALANAGLFTAGAMLVGTRAFNALSNMLGYRVSPNLATQDVDLATHRAIKLATPLPRGGLGALLADTGLRFGEVPGLSGKRQSTSWKAVGKELIVDLLVPAKSEAEVHGAVRIPGLGAHASALLTMDFLLREGVPAVVIGKTQLVPVTVPAPAWFCWHKIAVAALREVHMKSKAEKDLRQAAAIAVCLDMNGDLDELLAAGAAMPAKMRGQVRKAFGQFRLQFGDAYQTLAEAMAQTLA